MALVAVALLAAACGSGGGAGGGGDAVESAQRLILGAAQRTYTAGTAQVAVLLTGLGARAVGSGAVDFANGQSAVSVDLPSSVAGGGALVVTVDGTDTFLEPTGVLGADAVVVADPRSDVQQAALGQVNQVLLLLQPDQLLAALGGIGADAVANGDRRFSGTIDLDVAARALRGKDKRAFKAAIAALDDHTMAVKVTLDAQGRVRKLKATITLNDGTAVTATVTYSAFGQPVDITIPTEDQLVAPESFVDLDGTYEMSGDAIQAGAQIIVACSSASSCTVGDVGGASVPATRDGLVITANSQCDVPITFTFTADGDVTGSGANCVAGASTTGHRISP